MRERRTRGGLARVAVTVAGLALAWASPASALVFSIGVTRNAKNPARYVLTKPQEIPLPQSKFRCRALEVKKQEAWNAFSLVCHHVNAPGDKVVTNVLCADKLPAFQAVTLFEDKKNYVRFSLTCRDH